MAGAKLPVFTVPDDNKTPARGTIHANGGINPSSKQNAARKHKTNEDKSRPNTPSYQIHLDMPTAGTMPAHRHASKSASSGFKGANAFLKSLENRHAHSTVDAGNIRLGVECILKDVIKVMTNKGLFPCGTLHGVGSHYDGTIINEDQRLKYTYILDGGDDCYIEFVRGIYRFNRIPAVLHDPAGSGVAASSNHAIRSIVKRFHTALSQTWTAGDQLLPRGWLHGGMCSPYFAGFRHTGISMTGVFNKTSSASNPSYIVTAQLTLGILVPWSNLDQAAKQTFVLQGRDFVSRYVRELVVERGVFFLFPLSDSLKPVLVPSIDILSREVLCSHRNTSRLVRILRILQHEMIRLETGIPYKPPIRSSNVHSDASSCGDSRSDLSEIDFSDSDLSSNDLSDSNSSTEMELSVGSTLVDTTVARYGTPNPLTKRNIPADDIPPARAGNNTSCTQHYMPKQQTVTRHGKHNTDDHHGDLQTGVISNHDTNAGKTQIHADEPHHRQRKASEIILNIEKSISNRRYTAAVHDIKYLIVFPKGDDHDSISEFVATIRHEASSSELRDIGEPSQSTCEACSDAWIYAVFQYIIHHGIKGDGEMTDLSVMVKWVLEHMTTFKKVDKYQWCIDNPLIKYTPIGVVERSDDTPENLVGTVQTILQKRMKSIRQKLLDIDIKN